MHCTAQRAASNLAGVWNEQRDGTLLSGSQPFGARRRLGGRVEQACSPLALELFTSLLATKEPHVALIDVINGSGSVSRTRAQRHTLSRAASYPVPIYFCPSHALARAQLHGTGLLFQPPQPPRQAPASCPTAMPQTASRGIRLFRLYICILAHYRTLCILYVAY